jgi:hypothetical protein
MLTAFYQKTAHLGTVDRVIGEYPTLSNGLVNLSKLSGSLNVLSFYSGEFTNKMILSPVDLAINLATGTTSKGIIYSKGNIVISGSGTFRGTIISEGTVTITGTPTIIYDELVLGKLIRDDKGIRAAFAAENKGFKDASGHPTTGMTINYENIEAEGAGVTSEQMKRYKIFAWQESWVDIP